MLAIGSAVDYSRALNVKAFDLAGNEDERVEGHETTNQKGEGDKGANREAVFQRPLHLRACARATMLEGY